ncbi:rluC [Symbiodinium sp. CCMP2592]|nr:rluC [Symbiodinium sp. CCMP2592]
MRLEAQPAAASPAAVSAAAWAAARLQHAFPILSAEYTLARMHPQDVSNTLWAAAVLRCVRMFACSPSTGKRVHWCSRSIATTLWAYATVRICPPRATHGLLSDTFEANATTAGPQDLAQFLWASATLRLPLPALGQAHFGALSGQAAATSLWALSTLEQPPLLPTLARQAMQSALSPLEWANSLWGLANAGINEPKFFELAKARLSHPGALESLAAQNSSGALLANVAWAFAYAAELLGRQENDDEFLQSIRVAMRRLGADKGQRCAVKARSPMLVDAGGEAPRLEHHSGGVAVIYKPPGWEVDGSETRQTSKAMRLSHFVASSLASETVGSQDHGFGGRLDVASSGLVLHAETHEALMDLRWQQDTLRVEREYLALVHGFMETGLQCLDDRLSETEGGSSVSQNGRLSRSWALPIGHIAASSPYTLLAVSILTGRRHQIRVQLSSRGHPVVCDGRYGAASLRQDIAWCSRLFLHRSRLRCMNLNSEELDVQAPLPADLLASLELLGFQGHELLRDVDSCLGELRLRVREAEVEVAEPEEEIVLELEGGSTGPFTSASPEEQTPAEKPSPDISPSASSPEDKEVSASSGGASWKPPKARLGQLRNLFRRPSGAGHAGVTKSPLNSS